MFLIRHGQSEFNAIYSRTRVDPGIPDPKLTEEGHRQARAAARTLAGHGIERLIASPYTRALETATIIAKELGLAIEVEPLVSERAAFHCDIGTSPAELARRFPELAFDHLADPWWHDHIALGIDESEAQVNARGDAFRARAARLAERDRICVVTHWGFIRALTGIEAKNGEIL
ncbi:MAG: histidine phosphatase family protein, partial [Tagaea sp.]|nr:histidine phosphatase family protein [Tagaea sp.]